MIKENIVTGNEYKLFIYGVKNKYPENRANMEIKYKALLRERTDKKQHQQIMKPTYECIGMLLK